MALGLLEKIQSLMRDLQCKPEHFTDKIIFMSVYNDIAWGEKGHTERCDFNSHTVADYARKFPRGHWSFLGPGSEEKWYGTCTNRPDGSWNQSVENMIANFSGSGHTIFRASSASETGKLRSKGGGKKSMHISGSDENIELLLRSVISANQFSIYGAVADLCNEVPKDLRAQEKPAALDHLEKMKIPDDLSIAENSTNAQQRRNLVQEYERKFEQMSEELEILKTMF